MELNLCHPIVSGFYIPIELPKYRRNVIVDSFERCPTEFVS